MIIYKSSVLQNKDLDFDETFAYSKKECERLYPLLEIKKATMNGYYYRDNDDYLRANVVIKANVALSDSLTCLPFDKDIEIEDDFEIMDKDDGEGEGYIFPSSSFDSKELCLCLIHTYIPINPKKDD